jgi:hypothetical protein
MITARQALPPRRAGLLGSGGGGFGGDQVGAGATTKLGVVSHGVALGGGAAGGGVADGGAGGGAEGIEGGLGGIDGGIEGGSQGDVTSETPASGMVRHGRHRSAKYE